MKMDLRRKKMKNIWCSPLIVNLLFKLKLRVLLLKCYYFSTILTHLFPIYNNFLIWYISRPDNELQAENQGENLEQRFLRAFRLRSRWFASDRIHLRKEWYHDSEGGSCQVCARHSKWKFLRNWNFILCQWTRRFILNLEFFNHKFVMN